MKGRRALDVEWDGGANDAVSSELMTAAARDAVKKDGDVTETAGNVTAAKAGAARVVEQTYEVPLLAHAAMEPMNCTARVSDTAADVWVSTQFGDSAQQRVARFLGLPGDAVTVHPTFLGGGFGRRAYHDFVIDAVQIAKAAGKP